MLPLRVAQKANLSFKRNFVIDEVRDFKFATKLGFAKAQNHTQRKKWAWPWAGELPKTLGFPYNISATAEANDFKFGAQLGFAKYRNKITRRRKRKGGVALEGIA